MDPARSEGARPRGRLLRARGRRSHDRPAPTHPYQALLRDIARLYTQTRVSVVRMYWEIGRRIVEVEQEGADRAAYGGRLLPRLSADLTARCGVGFSLRNLQRMRVLYLQHTISPAPAHLSWTHQVELLSLPDARLRQQLMARAQRQGLSSQQLRALVQATRERLEARQPTDEPPASGGTLRGRRVAPTLLTPKRGTPGVFLITDLAGMRCLDLGFASYRALSEPERRRLHAGDLVRRASDGTLHRAPSATPTALYTYEARIERVVDGDTVWTLIRLAGEEWRREKLWLRGIDCPELGTSAGEAAKRFVQAQVARAARLVITTTKPDKWDRYLSDVWLTMADGTDVFLNNRLLEQGHARPYGRVSLEDWGA